MKLADILVLGLSIVFIVIGVDQTLVFGFQKSYWAFMLALTLFFVFTLRKNRNAAAEDPDPEDKAPHKKPSRRK